MVFLFALFHLFWFGTEYQANNMQSQSVVADTHKVNTTKKKPVIPEIIHFIWIYPAHTPMEFHHMICVLAAVKNIKPRGVILWKTSKPVGRWWQFVRQIVPHMALWDLKETGVLNGKNISRPEHRSDIARLDILIKHGGIYIDFDLIVLKPLNAFYAYDVTMGAESPHLLGSGLILSRKNATFLQIWRESYSSFNGNIWNYHSTKKPMELAKQYPSLIHIDWFGFHRPNWFERQWLYTEGKLWDWSENSAVHLWYRTHGRTYDPINIRCLNTTTGEILRYVYYNTILYVEPC